MLARQSNRGVGEEFYRGRFVTAVTNAWAEEREYLFSRPVDKRVQQTHIISIVEGDLPVVKVQINPDPLQGRPELQPCPRLRSSWVFVPVAQPQSPVTAFWAEFNPSVPVYSLWGHAQVPLRARAHFYLPVVSTWLEALGSQDVDTLKETLVVVGMVVHTIIFNCHSFVSGDINARVRCVNIVR